jgi:hypothetical protein
MLNFDHNLQLLIKRLGIVIIAAIPAAYGTGRDLAENG